MKRTGDVDSQTLLDLQPPAKHIHHSRNFAEADDLFIGKVPHMTPAKEREHMMFTETIKVDIFHDHHLVIGNRKESAV